jgi:hypothetical protein
MRKKRAARMGSVEVATTLACTPEILYAPTRAITCICNIVNNLMQGQNG